ncbi:hypothetical protein [Hydrogenoanaerobacterium sp.]|uniref:XkdQ/YqbQ family protein n=1 Tax=Hydrogenoanaerobacterium sp. TaxID=2953763 RepID=UPI00289D30AF|nr:hypothetical protein [Hydrogenoanaerobacterium sp.]
MLIVNKSDISEIANNIKLQSPWNNGASMLTFEYPVEVGEYFPNGATVVFTFNDANIFYGFLFKTTQGKKVYKCTAYDQLRYLRAKGSVMRQVQTLDSFLNDVAYSIGDRMRLGNVDKTEFMLGKYLFDNKTYLDMFYQSIQDNLIGNTYYYTLRDNFGALDLRDTLDLRLPLVIGDSSLATDFEYTRSIDDDTYNYVKVAKDDKQKGVRDAYVVQDGANIEKWGKLVLYEKVSANLNDAQLIDRAKMLLSIKNRETETLKIDCIGDTRVMGGSGIKVEIDSAGLNTWAMVENATHNFSKTQHTMTLNLITGRWYNGL